MRVLAFTLTLLASAPAFAASEGGGGGFVWQVLNFLLLVGVLYFVAKKPIVAFFADRRDQIKDEMESAADLLSKAEARHGELQRKLVDLDRELEEIRDASRRRAEEERDHILRDARAAAERIKADASVAIDQELRRAKADLAREASELSVELAADVLREQITDSDRDRLMDEFITSIERSGANGRATSSPGDTGN